jgi:hypothetical protein
MGKRFEGQAIHSAGPFKVNALPRRTTPGGRWCTLAGGQASGAGPSYSAWGAGCCWAPAPEDWMVTSSAI